MNTAKQHIVVLGAGFAGLWAAVGTARKLDELGIGPDRIAVTSVDRRAFHSIRVRNYEAELGGTRIPLDDILGPIGVARIEAEVSDIDCAERRVLLAGGGAPLRYDRLVFALGSRFVRPPIPGLAEYAFDVDTYERGAAVSTRISRHCQAAHRRPDSGQQSSLAPV